MIWGSTWYAIAMQLGTVPSHHSILYRFGLASLVLFGWCLFKKLNLKLSLKTHAYLFIQGMFLFSLNYLAAYTAGEYIESGLNAIGFSMVLFFNIINGFIFLRQPISKVVMCGAGCGLLGIFITFWPAIQTLDLTNEALYGIVVSLTGGILASFGNLISGRNSKANIPIAESNAYAMGYGALIMLGMALFNGEPLAFEYTPEYVVSLLYLVIFGTVLAFGCYLTLLARIGPSRAAYALIMVPIVALMISTVVEGFEWELHTIIGISLIFFGNVIVLRKKRNLKKSLKPIQSSPQEEKA